MMKNQKEKLKRQLEEAKRSALGIAYSKNVDILLGYISQLQKKLKSDSLLELMDLIEVNRYTIKEKNIPRIYDLLYEINHGVNVKDVVNLIKPLVIA